MTDVPQSVDSGRADSTPESLNGPSGSVGVIEPSQAVEVQAIAGNEASVTQPIPITAMNPNPVSSQQAPRKRVAQTLTRAEFQQANKLPEQFFSPHAKAAPSEVQCIGTKKPQNRPAVKKTRDAGQSQQSLTAFDFNVSRGDGKGTPTDPVSSGGHPNDRSATVSMPGPITGAAVAVNSPAVPVKVKGKSTTEGPRGKKTPVDGKPMEKKPRKPKISAGIASHKVCVAQASPVSMDAPSAPLVAVVDGPLLAVSVNEGAAELSRGKKSVADKERPLQSASKARETHDELSMLEFVELYAHADPLPAVTVNEGAAEIPRGKKPVPLQSASKEQETHDELSMLEFVELYAHTDSPPVVPVNKEVTVLPDVVIEEPADVSFVGSTVGNGKKPPRRSLRKRDSQAEITMLQFVEIYKNAESQFPKSVHREQDLEADRILAEKKAEIEHARREDEKLRKLLRAKEEVLERKKKAAASLPACLRTKSEGGSLPDAVGEEIVLLERDTDDLSRRYPKEVDVDLNAALAMIQIRVASVFGDHPEMLEQFQLASTGDGDNAHYLARVAQFFDLPDQSLSFLPEKFQWIAKLFFVTGASVNTKYIWQNIIRFLPEYLPNHQKLELYEEGQRLARELKQSQESVASGSDANVPTTVEI